MIYFIQIGLFVTLFLLILFTTKVLGKYSHYFNLGLTILALAFIVFISFDNLTDRTFLTISVLFLVVIIILVRKVIVK